MESTKTLLGLEKLQFDTQNPRLPLRLQGEKDEKKIIDYMVREGNIIELMASIAEMGYSDAEPLLVTLSANGNYTVVEGNRRLTALKLLVTPELSKLRNQSIADIINEAKQIPQSIPCIIYEKRDDILDYLGYRHITGVKDWGAIEKARYFDQLYQSHANEGNKHNIYSQLAKMIGSKPNYVFNIHVSLMLYERATENAYYGLGIEDDDIEFSWLYTIFGYQEIKAFLGIERRYDNSLDTLNEDNLKDLFMWMFSPKKAVITESRQIPKLKEIIASPEARKKLKKGATLEEALLYTSHPQDMFIKMVETARQNLKSAKESIEQLDKIPDEAMQILDEIKKIVRSISGALNENFTQKNEINFLENLKENPEMLKQFKDLLRKQS